MTEAVLLFVLRLLGAAILLGFIAGIAWIIYQDLRQATFFVVEEKRIQGWLRVISSESETAGVGTTFPLLPVTRIGRAENNSIVLEDGFVSAEHALLTRRDNQWWLEDLNSRNGTLLNDLPLEEPAIVSAGDVITIGSVSLKIEPGLKST